MDERAAGVGSRPEVKIVFVAMHRNIAELPALVRLAASLGVDELRVQNLSHSFSDTDPAGAYREIRAYAGEESLVGAAVAARTADEPGRSWPWESAYVTHRGEGPAVLHGDAQ